MRDEQSISGHCIPNMEALRQGALRFWDMPGRNATVRRMINRAAPTNAGCTPFSARRAYPLRRLESMSPGLKGKRRTLQAPLSILALEKQPPSSKWRGPEEAHVVW